MGDFCDDGPSFGFYPLYQSYNNRKVQVFVSKCKIKKIEQSKNNWQLRFGPCRVVVPLVVLSLLCLGPKTVKKVEKWKSRFCSFPAITSYRTVNTSLESPLQLEHNSLLHRTVLVLWLRSCLTYKNRVWVHWLINIIFFHLMKNENKCSRIGY